MFIFRLPLQFGVNSKLGCSIHVNASSLSESCPEIKRKSFSMLTGLEYSDFKARPKYVATFGNSDPAVTGDWVRVLHKNLPDYTTTTTTSDGKTEPRKCAGLVTSLHIEVIHARVGTFSHPQTKVLGVLYDFGKLTDQTFTCIGLACNHR